jgi:hypothetical protein
MLFPNQTRFILVNIALLNSVFERSIGLEYPIERPVGEGCHFIVGNRSMILSIRNSTYETLVGGTR